MLSSHSSAISPSADHDDEPSPSQHSTSQPPLFGIPEELWLEIFTLSTLSLHTCEDRAPTYHPFSAVAMKREDSPNKVTWRLAKYRLLLVCKAWTAIAAEVVYKQVRVGRGTTALLRAVTARPPPSRGSEEKGGDNVPSSEQPLSQAGESHPVGGYGPLVRHIEINPFLLDVDSFNPTAIVDILAQCSKVRALSRTYAVDTMNTPLYQVRSDGRAQNPTPIPGQASLVRTPPLTSFPMLENLTRVDWWMSAARPRCSLAEARAHSPPSAPSRNLRLYFIDLLGDILVHAPNLRYLAIGHSVVHPVVPMSGLLFLGCDLSSRQNPLCLPQLQTFRLELHSRMSRDLHARRQFWRLPKLAVVILGGWYGGGREVLRQCGATVRVIEYLWEDRRAHGWEPTDEDDGILERSLEALSAQCPALEELNFVNKQWKIGPALDAADERDGGQQWRPLVRFERLRTVRVGWANEMDARRMRTLIDFLGSRSMLPALERVAVCSTKLANMNDSWSLHYSNFLEQLKDALVNQRGIRIEEETRCR